VVEQKQCRHRRQRCRAGSSVNLIMEEAGVAAEEEEVAGGTRVKPEAASMVVTRAEAEVVAVTREEGAVVVTKVEVVVAATRVEVEAVVATRAEVVAATRVAVEAVTKGAVEAVTKGAVTVGAAVVAFKEPGGIEAAAGEEGDTAEVEDIDLLTSLVQQVDILATSCDIRSVSR
jgi:hypothetical protein